VKYLPEDSSFFFNFISTNLPEILFFFDGMYYEWPFRFLKIEHKNTFFRQENPTNYKKVGYFILFSWLCKIALLFKSFKTALQSKDIQILKLTFDHPIYAYKTNLHQKIK
jgi:hypothetical protein